MVWNPFVWPVRPTPLQCAWPMAQVLWWSSGGDLFILFIYLKLSKNVEKKLECLGERFHSLHRSNHACVKVLKSILLAKFIHCPMTLSEICICNKCVDYHVCWLIVFMMYIP